MVNFLINMNFNISIICGLNKEIMIFIVLGFISRKMKIWKINIKFWRLIVPVKLEDAY